LEQENELDQQGARARTHDNVGDDGIHDAYLCLKGNENFKSRQRRLLEA
jgi:hypothetical protein